MTCRRATTDKPTFLVLNLGLDVLNRVRGLHLEGDGLARQRLDENLQRERSNNRVSRHEPPNTAKPGASAFRPRRARVQPTPGAAHAAGARARTPSSCRTRGRTCMAGRGARGGGGLRALRVAERKCAAGEKAAAELALSLEPGHGG